MPRKPYDEEFFDAADDPWDEEDWTNYQRDDDYPEYADSGDCPPVDVDTIPENPIVEQREEWDND